MIDTVTEKTKLWILVSVLQPCLSMAHPVECSMNIMDESLLMTFNARRILTSYYYLAVVRLNACA